MVEVQDIPAWEKEQLYEARRAKESFRIDCEAGSTWQPSEFQREQPISLQLENAPDKLTLISCTRAATHCQCTTPLCSPQANL